MNNPKGFTLIELLVVVLIIGILAAVALPQYRKAVEKSRAVSAILSLDNLYRAEEEYFLANNQYTNHLDELSIDFSGIGYDEGNAQGYWSTKYYRYCRSWGGTSEIHAGCWKSQDASYYIGIKKVNNQKRYRCCWGATDESSLCKSIFPNGTPGSVGSILFTSEQCLID